MAERVHPSPPTAATVQIQMPENSIRKEQEETLIQNRQKDFVYGAPPALPPDHPSHAARRREGYGGKRRRGRCCCCMISFCATLAVIAVAVGITVGVMWLVLKPKVPEFRVKGAQVNTISMAAVEAGTTAVQLNATLGLQVEAENPNKKIGIYYDDISVGVKYDGAEIGTGDIAGFYQGHRNLTTIAVDIVGTNVTLTPSIASSLNASLSSAAAASLPLDAAVRASVRLRIGSLTTKSARVAVDCHILLSGASPGSSATVSSASCHFKLKSIDIF